MLRQKLIMDEHLHWSTSWSQPAHCVTTSPDSSPSVKLNENIF